MSKRNREPALKKTHHAVEAGAIAGEIAGAVIGSAAGPAGIVAGMVVGALAGTLVGEGLEVDEARVRAHDQELDETIGVTGGDLGAVQPRTPPAPSGVALEDESSLHWPMKDNDPEGSGERPVAPPPSK
jgi:hypothetical protein